MTTIAVKDGRIAADTCETIEGEGGEYCRMCEKLFRIKVGGVTPAVIGLAGESGPGLLLMEWLQTGDGALRDMLRASDADFTAVVCYEDGRIVEYDRYCVAVEIRNTFHAIGSGAKAALGAFWHGANALEAVSCAARVDPYTKLPATGWPIKEI